MNSRKREHPHHFSHVVRNSGVNEVVFRRFQDGCNIRRNGSTFRGTKSARRHRWCPEADAAGLCGWASIPGNCVLVTCDADAVEKFFRLAATEPTGPDVD